MQAVAYIIVRQPWQLIRTYTWPIFYVWMNAPVSSKPSSTWQNKLCCMPSFSRRPYNTNVRSLLSLSCLLSRDTFLFKKVPLKLKHILWSLIHWFCHFTFPACSEVVPCMTHCKALCRKNNPHSWVIKNVQPARAIHYFTMTCLAFGRYYFTMTCLAFDL